MCFDIFFLYRNKYLNCKKLQNYAYSCFSSTGKKMYKKRKTKFVDIKIDNFILRIVRDASACYPTCTVYT